MERKDCPMKRRSLIMDEEHTNNMRSKRLL